MIDFINKTITTQNQFISTSIFIPISKRINSDLYDTFSNLNFAGVYRIGSETEKRDCYIGSAYNITLKITHHLNLLYRGKHYSKELQNWVNNNGLENIDISVLSWCRAKPDEFEVKEQYYLNLIKPKFNSILNKYIPTTKLLDDRRKNWTPTYIFVNEDGSVTRIRGDVTNLPKKKKNWSDVEITEMPVIRRNIGFVGR